MSKLGLWLQQGMAWGAEYEDGLSNHLPMNLIALHRLGADDSTCEQFISTYSTRLQALRVEEAPIAEWREHLGQHSRNAAYRNYFIQSIQSAGRSETLDRYVRQLAPGISGAAFHPLIRLAFALEADSDLEIAEALASWCMAYQELGPLLSTGEDPPMRVLESIAHATRNEPPPLSGDTLFARMKCASTTPAFAVWNGRIAIDPLTLTRFAEAALAVYASSQNGFLALHLVTATHAARRLLRHTECHRPILQALGQAFLAAYIVMGCPPISPSRPCAAVPSWDEILASARGSMNDHDAKFCYALKDEQAVHGNQAYRREAARRMKLIPRPRAGG